MRDVMQVYNLPREMYGADLMHFCACLQTKQFDKKGHFLSWLRRNFGIWSVLAKGYLERTAISLGKSPFWG